MEKLSGERVLEIMNEVFEETCSYEMGEFVDSREPTSEYIGFNEDIEIEEKEKLSALFDTLGKFKHVAREETTGGDAYTVFYLEAHDVYLMIQGAYNSYESCADYDDYSFNITTPKQS